MFKKNRSKTSNSPAVPCKNCGSKPILCLTKRMKYVPDRVEFHPEWMFYSLRCQTCEEKGLHVKSDEFNDSADAYADWNKKHTKANAS